MGEQAKNGFLKFKSGLVGKLEWVHQWVDHSLEHGPGWVSPGSSWFIPYLWIFFCYTKRVKWTIIMTIMTMKSHMMIYLTIADHNMSHLGNRGVGWWHKDLEWQENVYLKKTLSTEYHLLCILMYPESNPSSQKVKRKYNKNLKKKPKKQQPQNNRKQSWMMQYSFIYFWLCLLLHQGQI